MWIDIYSAIRSGDVSILERIVSLAGKSTIYLKVDVLIYNVCLSNDLGIFEFVTTHFNLSVDDIELKKINELSLVDNTEHLDWNRIYSCAYNTKADVIMELVQNRKIDVKHLGFFEYEELPINPEVYDEYPDLVLNQIIAGTEKVDFFELIEWNTKRPAPSDRYLVLKKLDKLIRQSTESEIISFREDIIGEAILAGFVNIGNFFKAREYPIDLLPAGMYNRISPNPIGQYWYRLPSLLHPKTSSEFGEYLAGYHENIDHDPFIPSGVSMKWLIDRLLEIEVIDPNDLHRILKKLQEDYRFDPNYRLIHFVKLINRIIQIEAIRFQLLSELFEDPRINLEDTELLKLAGDVIMQENSKRSPLIDLHLKIGLSRQEKYDRIAQLEVITYPISINQFKKYYMMSNKELATVLNLNNVPWIPHLNSLVACLFLAGYRGGDLSSALDYSLDFSIAPISTQERIKNVVTIMYANGTYEGMRD